MRLLLVEDDTTLGDAVREYLAGQGHVVDWATCLAWRGKRPPNRSMRSCSMAAAGRFRRRVAARSARARTEPARAGAGAHRARPAERPVEGLDAGADDYLVKPSSSPNSPRACAPYPAVPSVSRRRCCVRYDGVDLAARTERLDGNEVELTAREYALLETLMRRRGRIVPRDLEQLLYGYDTDVASNTVEVHLSSLRRKLGRAVIETVRGMGYRVQA